MKEDKRSKRLIDDLSMQEVLDEVGERVKSIRKSMDLTLRSLGDNIGMAASYISEIEKGKTKPGFEFIYKLSRLYKVNPLYLLYGEEPVYLEEEGAGQAEKPSYNFSEGEIARKVEELLWYMERSEMVRFAIFEAFARYKRTNAKMIEEEVKESDEKKGK
jgi:transcriptional regulator with XRE-family HTH domain